MFWRISEVAEAIGVSPSVLRYWETRGLIAPSRSSGGYRLYSEREVALLRRIKYLREVMKMGLSSIAHVIEQQGPAEGQGSESAFPSADIGRRLRAIRRQKGMSLREIAEECGLSISFLSLFERGLSNVAVGKLHRLASAYGTTIGELLAPEGESPRRRVKPTERPYLETGGVRMENLSLLPLRLMEAQLFTVEPCAGSEEAYTHDGEEFLFVMEGCFDVWLDEKEHYRLEAGDSLCFPSSVAHRWRNPGQEPSRILWANSPPTF